MKHLIAFILILTCSCNASNTHYKNYQESLSDLLQQMQIETGQISILIDKSDYKLTVMKDTLIVKEYPVVFGGNPVDDKHRQGDQCTPEGAFKMISKYPHKNWSKFIWINYPTPESWNKHNQAKVDETIPANSKIGGEIGIHGVPYGCDYLIDNRQNWTLGCIALKNVDVDELYPFILETTVIRIKK